MIELPKLICVCGNKIPIWTYEAITCRCGTKTYFHRSQGEVDIGSIYPISHTINEEYIHNKPVILITGIVA